MNPKAKKFAAEWPFKWYGFWGDEERCLSKPFSKEEHVDQTWVPNDRAKLIDYLKSSPVALIGAVPEAMCVCGDMIQPAAFRSDDEWLWPDSLGHEVEKHFVVLPDSLVNHIRSRNYLTPTSISKSVSEMPWPKC